MFDIALFSDNGTWNHLLRLTCTESFVENDKLDFGIAMMRPQIEQCRNANCLRSFAMNDKWHFFLLIKCRTFLFVPSFLFLLIWIKHLRAVVFLCSASRKRHRKMVVQSSAECKFYALLFPHYIHGIFHYILSLSLLLTMTAVLISFLWFLIIIIQRKKFCFIFFTSLSLSMLSRAIQHLHRKQNEIFERSTIIDCVAHLTKSW